MKKHRLSKVVFCVLLVAACVFTGALALGETAAHRVEPIPPTIDLTNMPDCTFAASFEPEDVYLDDDGALMIHLTVYDHELFDPADIAKLAVGDTIVIDGEDQTVTSLEMPEDGYLLINGGFDADGFTLETNADGAYYAIGASDSVNYRELGEATLRVSEEFTLEDTSEFQDPADILYAGDLLEEGALDNLFFLPSSTDVTFEGGFITMIKLSPAT